MVDSFERVYATRFLLGPMDTEHNKLEHGSRYDENKMGKPMLRARNCPKYKNGHQIKLFSPPKRC